MLTVQQAREIVRSAIYGFTGQFGDDPSRILNSFGIDSEEKLNQLRLAIIEEVAVRYGRTISLSHLQFGTSTPLGAIYFALVHMPDEGPSEFAAGPGGMARPPGAAKQERKGKEKKGAANRTNRGAGGHLSAEKGKNGGRDQTAIKNGEHTKSRKPKKTEPVVGTQKGGGKDRIDLGSEAAAAYISEYVQVGRGTAKAEPPLKPLPALPSRRTIQSVPQIEIRGREIVGKNYRMSVFVNQEQAATDAEVTRVVAEIPVDEHEFELDVWLDCSSHFRLAGVPDVPRIRVNAESGVSDELEFGLIVVNRTDELPMYVSAFFRYNGRPSGKIKRYLEWRNGELTWKKTPLREESTEGAVVLPNADSTPSVVLEIHSIPADIRVEVLTKTKNGQNFTLKCYTPQGSWDGDWNLPEVSKDLVNTYMKNFMADRGEARIASLEGAGMDFWDALPPETSDLLWTALERGAQSMSIVSEEPYIPWELMIPYKRVQNPRKPLGIDLQIGRWITGNYVAARQKLSLKSGYIICPKTSGLKGAVQEVTFLTQCLQPRFNQVDDVAPASFSGVNAFLTAGPRDLVHFMCHGKSSALQTLLLDTPDTLNCSQVRTLKGFKEAFKNGPIAFLNACEVGGQILALDGVGGFANSFIQMGASCVIAPLWAVQDSVALDVTQTFYPQALQGIAFGSIMKQIRAKAYSQALDSYAAYCFYGDPMVSLAQNLPA